MTGPARLHVETHGDRANPALVLVHALGTDHRFWDEPVADLSRDLFCILPDLQGAGRTANPLQPVSAEAHAADLLALVNDLEVERVVFVGCAIGGMVAALAAIAEPARAAGVVMTNPGVRNADEVKGILRARVDEVREKGMAALLPAAPERSFHNMPRDARFDRYVERYIAQDPEGYALSVLGFLDIDIRAALPRLSCPTLLIPGGNDILMPGDGAEIIASLVPHARIERFDDVAHFVPFQAPERFVATLRRFLSEDAAY